MTLYHALNLLGFSVSLFYVCYIIYQTPSTLKFIYIGIGIFELYFLTYNPDHYFRNLLIIWALYFLWLFSFVFFLFTIYLYENFNTLKIIGTQKLFITTLFEKMT